VVSGFRAVASFLDVVEPDDGDLRRDVDPARFESGERADRRDVVGRTMASIAPASLRSSNKRATAAAAALAREIAGRDHLRLDEDPMVGERAPVGFRSGLRLLGFSRGRG